MPVYDIYFDSRERISGTPSDATFQLTHPLSNVRSVYCKSFQFQNTFENITSTTNRFEMQTLNTPTVITIPPGMYNATSIVQKLNDNYFCIFTLLSSLNLVIDIFVKWIENN